MDRFRAVTPLLLPGLPYLSGLDHVVRHGSRYFLEPMRSPGWHNDHVSLADLPRLAAVDLDSTNLVGGDIFWINHRSTGYKCGSTFLHVDDVRILQVNLCHASF